MLRTEMYSSHFDRSIDHFAGPATREIRISVIIRCMLRTSMRRTVVIESLKLIICESVSRKSPLTPRAYIKNTIISGQWEGTEQMESHHLSIARRPSLDPNLQIMKQTD